MDVPKQYAPFVVAAIVGVSGFFLGEWYLMAWLLAAAIASGGVIWEDSRWGILATATLGLGCSAYLFTLKLNPGGPAICDVGQTFSCSGVNDSAASELFGIPIALLGSGYFLGLGIASVLARDSSARLFATTAATASLGILYSLYLAYEATQLETLCMMCITIYICTGLLLWAGLKGLASQGETLQEVAAQIPGSTSFVTTSATLVVVVLVGLSTYSGRTSSISTFDGSNNEAVEAVEQGGDQELLDELAQAYSYAPGSVDLEGTEPVLGDPNAPYLIVEFADFGCPHCADAAVHLKKLVQQTPEVQVRFRPFALSGACNPVIPTTERAERCYAAMAAECANQQGKFWDYASFVFSNQRDLSDAALARAAESVGLDMATWNTCRQDRSTLQSVVNSAAAGERAGVKGTPAIYVKGLHEDRWIEICGGADALLPLITLHKRGIPLPDPARPSCF